jgi:hypothetical protein
MFDKFNEVEMCDEARGSSQNDDDGDDDDDNSIQFVFIYVQT